VQFDGDAIKTGLVMSLNRHPGVTGYRPIIENTTNASHAAASFIGREYRVA